MKFEGPSKQSNTVRFKHILVSPLLESALRDVPDLYNGCLVPGSTDIGIFFEVRASGRYVNENTNDWGMFDAFKFRDLR